jgi:putative membrane protein
VSELLSPNSKRNDKETDMNKHIAIACSFAAMIFAATNGHAQTSNPAAGNASAADQAFLNEAIQGDLAEVNMGKLAQEKGQSEAAKQFGQMLEQDHGQHLQKAKDSAQQMGMTPPTEPNAKQKKMYDQLSKMSGAQFDKEFAQHMVKDHKEDIGKYEREAKSKGPLAQFAQQTIPTLQKHLQTAERLAEQKSSKR